MSKVSSVETEPTGTNMIDLGNRVDYDPAKVGRVKEKEEMGMTLWYLT